MKILDISAKYGYETAQIFEPLNPDIRMPNFLKQIEEEIKSTDLLCFGGGEDIHTSIYGHRNIHSHCGPMISLRDVYEIQAFNIALKHEVPMLGICRGAQLLCALSGGALIQDIDARHTHGGHILETKEWGPIPMTSTHHQMMWPFKMKKEEFDLLGWIDPIIKKGDRPRAYLYDAKQLPDVVPDKEPEIVFFPKTRVLAVQGHPEYYQSMEAPPVKFVRQLVFKYLGVGK